MPSCSLRICIFCTQPFHSACNSHNCSLDDCKACNVHDAVPMWRLCEAGAQPASARTSSPDLRASHGVHREARATNQSIRLSCSMRMMRCAAETLRCVSVRVACCAASSGVTCLAHKRDEQISRSIAKGNNTSETCNEMHAHKTSEKVSPEKDNFLVVAWRTAMFRLKTTFGVVNIKFWFSPRNDACQGTNPTRRA